MPEQPRLKFRYLMIGGAIVALVAVLAGRREPGREPVPSCDRAAARRAWLTAKPADGNAPEHEGYQILGECGTKLLHRELSCEEPSVRQVNADNPYLKEALALGFVTYVCELPSGSRIEYPLQHLLAP